MASNDLTAVALRFLTDAGHLLATAAPETSAYVMSRRNDLMFEHEMPVTDKQREKVCTCCGHIMRLGDGSRLQVKPEKRQTRKRPSHPGSKSKDGKDSKRRRLGHDEQTPSGSTKAITCGRCARMTEIKLPAPAPISRRKVKLEKASKNAGVSAARPSSTTHEAPSQKTTSNASSKKRAKSRKAGLQALLSQSSASRPGLGLSLADFMDKK